MDGLWIGYDSIGYGSYGPFHLIVINACVQYKSGPIFEVSGPSSFVLMRPMNEGQQLSI